MARIPQAVIEDIRQKVNIVDVVSQYVQLKKSGKNLFGLCPFHEEKTPSFSVDEQKQMFYCFSCGRGGNVFKFIMDIEDCSFPEAVIKVAKDNNIPLDPAYEQGAQTVVNSTDTKLRGLYEQAQALYHHILVNTPTGKPALHYLHQRGMSDETIETFGIGFAPDKRDLLKLFFDNKKIEQPLLEQSGLFAVTSQGQLLDRFVDRVMFPIKDQGGQVIAFSGRILHKNPDSPKYLNSPETPIFNKRRVLFNYNLAKSDIRKLNSVLLFEGFMDVISAFQAGVKNGVASMGTSLTDDQLYLLKRTTNHLVICYDGDAPGVNAANRALDMLSNQTVDLGVIVLPDEQDPDEFIKNKGPKAFQQIIRNGELTTIQFKLDFLKRNLNLNNDKTKLDYLQQALTLLKQKAVPAERSLYLKRLATELNLDLEDVRAQFNSLRVANHSNEALQPQGKYQRKPQSVVPVIKVVKYSRLEKAERLLLHYCLHDEGLCRRLVSDETFKFQHEVYQTLFELWLTFLSRDESVDISAFTDQLPPNLQNTLADLEMQDYPDNDTDTAIDDLLSVLAKTHVQQKLKAARNALQTASETGNVDEEVHWTSEIIKLSKDLKGA